MGSEAAHAAGLIAAILMGAGLYVQRARRSGAPTRAVLASLIIMLPLAPLLGRAFVVLVRAQYLLAQRGPAAFLDFSPAGLSFVGVTAALLIGAFAAERLFGLCRHALLDPLSLGALLTLLLERLSEYFVTFGQGAEVYEPFFQRFPFAVKNEWDEWYAAVFMLEALIALLLLADAARRARPAGERWQRALYLFLLWQILCESLRAETLRWGFVRVHQLFCLLGAGTLLAAWCRRAARLRLHRGLWIAPALCLPLAAALLVGLEFALDRWVNTPHLLLYAVMAAALAALSALGLRLLSAVGKAGTRE